MCAPAAVLEQNFCGNLRSIRMATAVSLLYDYIVCGPKSARLARLMLRVPSLACWEGDGASSMLRLMLCREEDAIGLVASQAWKIASRRGIIEMEAVGGRPMWLRPRAPLCACVRLLLGFSAFARARLHSFVQHLQTFYAGRKF